MNLYKEILTEGICKGWGFGRKRIRVTSPDKLKCPYSFTGLGYKNKDGQLFLGLRMNVDQHSPLKLKEWTNDLDVELAWGYMVTEFVDEFVQRARASQLLKKVNQNNF